MLNKRLQIRVPSASPLTTGLIRDYCLSYHKKGMDGSGKCTIKQKYKAKVYGVVFEIDRKEKKKLNIAEGLGNGYESGEIIVETTGQKVQAYTYIAENSHIDQTLRPYLWYKKHVIAGARQHHLPDRYISSVLDVETVRDRNEERVKENMHIIHATG
jgi:hypothetical protein